MESQSVYDEGHQGPYEFGITGSAMDVIQQLLGRLHPLVVHVPIGFIILGVLLQWYDRKKHEFNTVLALVYLWAGYAAIFACITGYLQYSGEGYAFDTVKIHLWSGIATALFSFVLWARLKQLSLFGFLKKVPVLMLTALSFVLISFTGHQGGNITHGEDYLVEPLPNTIKAALGYEIFEAKEVVLSEDSWEEAVLYTDVVQPILNNNCVSCHNPKKTKGELLLHTPEGILESGEHGPVVNPNHPDESELVQRMLLPKTNDQHMPPDGKTQPSKEEIRLLTAWVENGLSFDKTIGELGLEKRVLESFFPKTVRTDYPPIEIAEAAKDSIASVKAIGLHVDPISESTYFLKVSALNMPSFTDADILRLTSIAPNVAILDLGGTQVTVAVFKALVNFPNLVVLKLDHTNITGEGIAQLEVLTHLRSINLSSTGFTVDHLTSLERLQALETLFLFNTIAGKTGVDTLKAGALTVEYGNYQLAPLETDSIVY